MLIVTASAKAKKGKESELRSELFRVSQISKKEEKGCLGYVVHQSSSNPLMFMTYETWKTENDHHNHLQTSHVQHIFSKVPELCDGTPEITTWLVSE